jgi:hypothetical protein
MVSVDEKRECSKAVAGTSIPEATPHRARPKVSYVAAGDKLVALPTVPYPIVFPG